MKRWRSPLALAIALAARSLVPADAAAAPPAASPAVAECLAAADQGQVARDEGKLLDARAQFLKCGRPECPGQLQRDCAQWLLSVETRIPSIVPTARDYDGGDLVDVRVFVDGEEHSIGGTPISLDPGAHVIRFEREGDPPVEQKLIVRDGEQNRLVTVRFGQKNAPAVVQIGPAAPPQREEPPPSPPPRQSNVDAYVIGGLGLVGVAGFAVLTVMGNQEIADLRETCAPRCAQGDVDAARDKFTIANVSLGVGGAALAIAAYLVFSRATSSRAAQSALVVGPAAVGARF